MINTIVRYLNILSLVCILASCTPSKADTQLETPQMDQPQQQDTTVVVTKPAVSIKEVTNSWYSAIVTVKLTKDFGESRTVGVQLGDELFYSASRISRTQSVDVLVEGLCRNAEASLVPFAVIGDSIAYGSPVRWQACAEPEALSVDWTAVTGAALPSGVKLYKAASTVTGANVNMWYASVDSPSALSCVLEESVSKPEALSAKYSANNLIINGGYFGKPSTSYSHVTTDGVRKARNIAAVSRTYSYALTRPAFGVTADGKPEIRWIYDDSNTTAYDHPLPVVDGENAIAISRLEGGQSWKIQNAIGGAPVLLRDGHICFDFLKSGKGFYISNHDLLQSDIFAQGLKAPRTAIGYKSDGSVILFVCDGRSSGGSAGLTLDELAAILKGLGCTDAMNLDGGGSSAICVNGAVLNKPSDGSSRAVLSFVVVK